MRTDSTAIAGVAMGEARRSSAQRFGERVQRCRQGPRLQDEGEGRPGGARVDPADLVPARPRLAARAPEARGAPALPPDLAARARVADGAQGARDDDRRAGRRTPYGLRASATRTLFDGFSRGLHRGPRRRRRGGGRAHAARRSPRATSTIVERRHADPALHRAAAALHRGDADQGARGARHRPAVDVRGDDLDDRRPRLRPGRGAAAAPRGDRRRSSPTCWSSTSASTWTSSSPRGWRRSSTRSPAASAQWVPLLREFYGAAQDARRREAPRAQARRLHDRGDRRGLLRGPPDGHPARPQRAVPRLLAVPGAQGDAAAARRGGRRSSRATARPARSAARARSRRSAAGSGRSSAARATRTALHPQGRPAAARPAAVRGHLPQERRRAPRRASRAAHRQRLLGVLALPEVRLHDATTSRRARSTTTDTDGQGAIVRRGEAGMCLTCGADDRAARRASSPGCGWPVARRTRRRSSGRPGGGRRGGGGRTGGGRRATPGGRPARSGASSQARRRVSVRAGARDRPPDGRGMSDADDALRRFLRSLEARDASPHTQRSYETAVAAYLDWLEARGADWQAPGRADPPRLPRGARPRATRGRRSRSGWPRCARSTATRPVRARAGRPVGRHRHAAPAAPPAAGPRGGPGRGAARGGRRGPRPGRCRGRRDDRPRPWPPRPRPRAGHRAARPGPRRDRLRRRAADQRARRGRPRLAGPAARRAARPGQGPQGADRAAGTAGPRGARGVPRRGRPVLAAPRRLPAPRSRPPSS